MSLPLLSLDPFTRTSARFSKKGWGFVLVVLFHIVLIVLLEQVLERSAQNKTIEVVTAQLVSEFHAPEPPKPEPPPKLKTPPPLEPAPSNAPIALSATPSTSPAITVTPAATAPVTAPTPALVAPHVPVVVAAVVRSDSCEKPPYPAASQRLREEGVVTLKFLINETGQVLDSKVENSSGYKRLDEAARAGLSLCKFRPAMVDGKVKQEWLAMRYRWELTD